MYLDVLLSAVLQFTMHALRPAVVVPLEAKLAAAPPSAAPCCCGAPPSWRLNWQQSPHQQAIITDLMPGSLTP